MCTLRPGGVPLNWDSKQRAYSCFPIELDWVLGFTVAVQPNLRAVKCQHALDTHFLLVSFFVSNTVFNIKQKMYQLGIAKIKSIQYDCYQL